MRGSATRGAASLVWWVATLASAWGVAHASGAATATTDGVRSAGVPALTASGSRDTVVLEGRPIARIEIESRDIFEPVPPGRMSGLFRVADALHVRTRPATIRSHVLLRPGGPWSDARALESERDLRGMDIFDSARIRGRSSGDSVVVRVETHDAWTTNPEFTLEHGGGRTFGSFRFSERNLMGRAQEVGVSYRSDPSGISRAIELADPGVRGTRVQVAGSASEGSAGTMQSARVELPFYAEDAPYSFGFQLGRARTTAHLFGGGAELASFARHTDGATAWFGAGRRFGETIGRLTGSLFVLDRRFGDSALEPGAPADFGGTQERLKLRRLAIEGVLWHPDFRERAAVEQLDGIEDYDLGPSAVVAVGFSPVALGGSEDEGYVAARLNAGADAGPAGFGWLRCSFSSRLPSGVAEGSGRVEARWVNQSVPRQTLVVAALTAAHWGAARDQQLVVGGLSGLRAHSVYALSGERLWRLNAESRWVIRRNIQHLLSVGVAAFWDAAHMRGPGSGDAPWQHDAGFGLRLGFPRSALDHVARFDVAWPITSLDGRHAMVFSFGSSQGF